MEILVALVGAGIAGISLLVQSKALPSEADYKKAAGRLKDKPDDPEASLVAGKYLVFVAGDWKAGAPLLAKSSDKALKALAEHELDPTHVDTALKKVGMGDEWVKAAAKAPQLFRVYFDRAAHWYVHAWKELAPDDFLWRQKLREQAAKISAARPPGAARKGLPTGWIGEGVTPQIDGIFSHYGSLSVRIPHGDPKAAAGSPQATGMLKADPVPVKGKEIEVSAWVRSDGTDSPLDRIFVNFFNKQATGVWTFGPLLSVDLPFWVFVQEKTKVPEDIVFVQAGAVVHSKNGNVWVDDLSVKFDGREALKNTSFEER